ncbi:MAG: hypothetical protein AAB381_02080 [Patescibacteria group bacterium]
MKKSSKGSPVVTATVVGAAVAGLAATAYFFLSPKSKQHRAHAKAWSIRMKADVIEKLEQARELSEPMYHQLIDTIATEYATGQKAGTTEIKALAQDLKKQWKKVSAKKKKATRKK